MATQKSIEIITASKLISDNNRMILIQQKMKIKDQKWNNIY